MPKVPDEECMICGQNHKGACESIKIKKLDSKTHHISRARNASIPISSKSVTKPPRISVSPQKLFAAPTRKDPDTSLMKACDALYELIAPESVLEHQTLFTAAQVKAAHWKKGII